MLPINVTDDLSPHDRKNVEALLEELARTALDSALGYDLAAIRTPHRPLRLVLEGLAARRREHALELSAMLHREEHERPKHGTLLGALHRGIIELRSQLHPGDIPTILSECERGDHAAIGRYETGLRERLPADVASLLVDQSAEIRETRDAFDRMRRPW